MRRIVAAALLMCGGLAMAADRPLPPGPDPDPVKANGLTPSFAEEFGGRTLDRKRWVYEDPRAGVPQRTLGNNAEREIYVDPPYLDLGIDPVAVHDGVATITARPFTPAERMVVQAAAAALPHGEQAAIYNDIAYASGRIMTRHKFSQLYGYWEARLRFSPGRGMWPAFWLLPDDGGWPPEIDIMEVLGHEPDKLYQTVHSGAMPNQGVTATMTPTRDGFHRYGVLWGPQTTDYYVDGVKTGSVKTPADAHKPMYLILNLAVGGNWPGFPDASTKFPATMDIDYVRAWRLPKR